MRTGLTPRDLQGARFRCLDEVESVRYSIQDLECASWHLKWLTGSGQRLVKQSAETIEQVEHNIAPHKKQPWPPPSAQPSAVISRNSNKPAKPTGRCD